MLESIREKMARAKWLIEVGEYDAARAILRTVNHDTAFEWLDKLDQIDPPKRTAPVTVSNKSYTNAAVVVLVLYFLLFIPGLIANFMYYSEALRAQKEVKHSLPGVGALELELVLFGVTGAIVIAFIIGTRLFIRGG